MGSGPAGGDRLGDAHVGPQLTAQLRSYCPKEYLERFDESAVAHDRSQAAAAGGDSEEARLSALVRDHPNMRTAGHHDVSVRIQEMDRDGVAAELMWHFSQNGEPFSFAGHGLGTVSPEQFELGGVGYRIYNRWLADFCSTDDQRLLGLVYLPMWDIDAAVRELEWARRAGLRVVNFPPPGRPGIPEYNSRELDPFWSACEDLGMALATDSSGGPLFNYEAGPGARRLMVYEGGGWLARRSVWWLIYGEVFERHPKLKLVITEQYEGWWLPMSSARLRVHDLRRRPFAAPAAERVRQVQRVPGRQLHVDVPSRRGLAEGLRRQRALGP